MIDINDNRNNNYKVNAIFVRTVNILTASIEKYSSEGIHGSKDSKIIEDSRGNKGDNGKGGEDMNQQYKDYSRMDNTTRVNAIKNRTRVMKILSENQV